MLCCKLKFFQDYQIFEGISINVASVILLLLLLDNFDSFSINCVYHRLGECLPNGSRIVLPHVLLAECSLWVFVRQVSKLVLDQVLERMEHVVYHFR
jgi:hypothetical protein